MSPNRFQNLFMSYFLGLFLGCFVAQFLALLALGALGVLYLDRGYDHLFTSLAGGFLSSGAVIFAFILSFLGAHAYHGGRTVPMGSGAHLVAGAAVMAAANGLAFAAALVTGQKETQLLGAFALSALLSLPAPWILRVDRKAVG